MKVDPLFYIFYLFPLFRFKSLFAITLRKKWKGKRSQKLTHRDTGIEYHLSTGQEKQKVWSLNKKKEKWGKEIECLEFCGFFKTLIRNFSLVHCLKIQI